MSVVKSKRKTSSTQFLVNIQSLQKEVLAWCKSQGAKNAPYGLTNMFNAVNKAFINAYEANKIYLKEDTYQQRKQLFDNSIRWLHVFNAELTALAECYNISNTKIKRWCGYSYNAINLIDGVKASDTKRIKKISA